MGRTAPPRRPVEHYVRDDRAFIPVRLVAGSPEIDYGDLWQGTPEIDRRLRVILGEEPDDARRGRYEACAGPYMAFDHPVYGLGASSRLAPHVPVTGMHGTTCCYYGTEVRAMPWEGRAAAWNSLAGPMGTNSSGPR